jgi:hypothetical protein
LAAAVLVEVTGMAHSNLAWVVAVLVDILKRLFILLAAPMQS